MSTENWYIVSSRTLYACESFRAFIPSCAYAHQNLRILCGISGRAALSEDGNMLYATNLNNGIDAYAINKKRSARSYFERTLEQDIGSNVPLPIISIHDGRDLLVGTTLGKVEVVPSDGDGSRASFSVAAPGHGSECLLA